MTTEAIAPVPAAYAAPHSHPLVDLPLSVIQRSTENPRADFNGVELASLAKSLREHGQIEPIVVRPLIAGECYELIAGERRLRAAQIAGLSHLAAIVRFDLNERGAQALRLIENLHRVQLNPLEEAHGFAAMHEALGMTQGEIARLAGRGQPAIAKRLALLKLPEEVQGFIARGTLSQSHADALANLTPFPAIQTRIAQLAASQKWPVSTLEKLSTTVWDGIVHEKLAVRLGHATHFKWEEVCAACPFDAHRKVDSWAHFCLRPEHHAELEAEERQAREAAAAAARVQAEANGVEAPLPKLEDLTRQDYERLDYTWIVLPPGCTEACPCRSTALECGQVIAICTDRARHDELKRQQQVAVAAARQVYAQRRREQLAAHMDGLQQMTGRAMALVVHRVLDRADGAVARRACKDYGYGLSWPKKEKLPSFDELAALSAPDLLRIAVAVMIGDEIQQRQEWSSSRTEHMDWYLGPVYAAGATEVAAAIDEGACSACGAGMELAGEDLADPASALCADCG